MAATTKTTARGLLVGDVLVGYASGGRDALVTNVTSLGDGKVKFTFRPAGYAKKFGACVSAAATFTVRTDV